MRAGMGRANHTEGDIAPRLKYLLRHGPPCVTVTGKNCRRQSSLGLEPVATEGISKFLSCGCRGFVFPRDRDIDTPLEAWKGGR